MNVHSLSKKIMDKRTKILKATEQLLAQQGFYAFSMQSLADLAGVAAGTIYRYFASKEVLMCELQKHLIEEAAKEVFTNWSEELTLKQKYNLMWNNTFHSVINNPQRLAVCEMLYCIPEINKKQTALFEDAPFKPLFELYQQGIDEQIFLNWKIAELSVLSFETSISLAKKVTRGRLSLDQVQLDQVREVSWKAILNPLHNQQD